VFCPTLLYPVYTYVIYCVALLLLVYVIMYVILPLLLYVHRVLSDPFRFRYKYIVYCITPALRVYVYHVLSDPSFYGVCARVLSDTSFLSTTYLTLALSQVVLKLLEDGAPFVIDSDGQTALHQAAAGGHADTVAALILGGCDASVQDFVSYYYLYIDEISCRVS
jgi:hypothetical protein